MDRHIGLDAHTSSCTVAVCRLPVSSRFPPCRLDEDDPYA
jgi:hypothetical protein